MISIPVPTKKPPSRQPTKPTHKRKIVGKNKAKVLPTIKGANGEIVGKKLKGWIEFTKSGKAPNIKRYAKRRRWIKKGGLWVKSKAKRVKEIPPLTEDQYTRYKARQEAAKEARRAKDS